MSVREETVRGLLVAVLVAVTGVVLGLAWLWLSPRVPLVSDGQAVYLKDTEGEEAIGGDGTFVLIAVVLGVLSAAAVFWRYRRGGVGVVLGLAAGGALASVIGWRLGVALGPTGDIVAHAKAVGPRVVFDGPLELRARSALVAFPAAAMLAHLALTSVLGPREAVPAAPPAPLHQPPPGHQQPQGFQPPPGHRQDEEHPRREDHPRQGHQPRDEHRAHGEHQPRDEHQAHDEHPRRDEHPPRDERDS